MSKRKIKHIDYALISKPHTPMYLMHKYWARKPHNVVAEYIKNYTKEGDIILDPFCGSGPAPIEAIKLGRKAVAIDLNLMSTFITRMTAMPINITRVKQAFDSIETNCKDKIEELFKTECKECGNDALTLATIWDRDKKQPLEIRYYCENCNKRNAKKPDDKDLKLLKKVEKMKVPYWYPKTKLSYNGDVFLKKEKSDSVSDLFSKSNLISLSILFNEIEKIKSRKTREVFQFAFTSMSHLASRMCPVAKPGGKGHWSKFSATSFWAMHSYWVPPVFMESNVWMLFRSAVHGKQGIIKGKTDSDEQIAFYREAKKFDDLNDGANILLKTHNAMDLTDIVPKNSIDYVFTDPPYGGAVQYFELSTMWASWLDKDLSYDEEITINLKQNKEFEYYHKMLRASFREIYQVLKPGKYMTVTFHSTDIKVWNSIIKAVVAVGFEMEKIIYQPPARPSAKGLLQPYGSAVGDYYIRFRKPKKKVLETEKEIDLNTYELEVVDIAQIIIGERGEPTIYQYILNGIMAELQGGRRVPVGAKNIEDVLKDHIGMEFELIPIKNNSGKTIGKKWWLKGVDMSHFSKPTLSDRVERKIVEVLENQVTVSFDDILQAIFIEFPNALTPETGKVKDVLREYATPVKNHNWMLKRQVKIRESQHSKLIYYLAMLGRKTGLDVWIGQREQGERYNKKKLASLITIKSPVWRFVSSMNWDRIKQIDVIWHDQGRIRYEFEVENTTAITEAIVRGSNIPDGKLIRLIVIPEEREGFLFKKLKEPMLSERITKSNWKFVFYRDVEKFFEQNSKKRKIDLNDFEKLFKLPQEAKQLQDSLFDSE